MQDERKSLPEEESSGGKVSVFEAEAMYIMTL